MRVKELHSAIDLSIEMRGNLGLACEPHENVPVEFFHQQFERINIRFTQRRNMAVNEFAKDKVHFTHTTMPRAILNFAAAGIERG